MLSAVINGLINGYIYKYTNSIIPSIVSHISNNLVASHFNFQKYSTFYDKITQNIIFLNKNKINTSF
jgi:membrane protease YdiL (CAAX protease family)